MSNTDDLMRAAVSRNELFAELGGIAVIAGLVAEVVLTWAFNPGGSLLERWGPVGADAVVALGVAAEVLFSRRSRARAEELQRSSDERVANAEERAAEANRETERIKAQFGWRNLSREQREKFLNFLPSSEGSVTVEFLLGDVESINFATLLARGFGVKGWKVGLMGGSYAGGFEFGIRVASGTNVSTAIEAALTAAEIPFTSGTVQSWGMRQGAEGGTGPSHCRIYVGPRPPPKFV